jgi:hypothetical protein
VFRFEHMAEQWPEELISGRWEVFGLLSSVESNRFLGSLVHYYKQPHHHHSSTRNPKYSKFRTTCLEISATKLTRSHASSFLTRDRCILSGSRISECQKVGATHQAGVCVCYVE